ncbi:MAG: DUF1638 domain-containing protein [Thermoguttaceae bacterium]
MRLRLIACEVLFRELCHLISRSPHRIDATFLPKALHDIGCVAMRQRLGEAIAEVDETQYDAIILGYALCNGGIVGLKTQSIPLVIPRAHDCITLLLGDRHRYHRYFFEHPGTYFKSTGWIERGDFTTSPAGGMAASCEWESMVAKYGEENARYIIEQMTSMTHYSRMAFIATGIEPSDAGERETERLAAERGWEYERLTGDLDLLRRLVDGDWNNSNEGCTNDFFVLAPQEAMTYCYDAIDTP